MRKIFTISLLVLFYGCQDTDEIPFASTEPIVVVEGWLTDNMARQYVKLTSTVEFTSPLKSTKINDAKVTLHSSISSSPIRYINQGNGLYLSESSLKGIPGRSYYLEIELASGEVIQSLRERMSDVPTIDSLGFDFFLREDETNPQKEVTIYFPVAFSNDPPEQSNFYRWKLYRNDTLFSKPEEIFLFSDRFVNGNDSIPQEFNSYEYRLNDKAKLEVMEISRNAFQFLNQLKSQTTTLGTNSAVSPAPIKGNLAYSNSDKPVLGFFGTVSVKKIEKIVQ